MVVVCCQSSSDIVERDAMGEYVMNGLDVERLLDFRVGGT